MGKKLKIAITGGLGSGKSVVCDIFHSKGYPTINSDAVAKDILENDESVKKKIISEFGAQAYENDGKPNKKYLANKVFSDPEKVKKINSIVHPPTIKKINNLMEDFLKEKNLVFVESALIYEANMSDYFDLVLLVTTTNENKLQRALERDDMKEEDAKKRIQNQIPDAKKKELADFVIDNNKSLVDLKINAEFMLKIFEGMLI